MANTEAPAPAELSVERVATGDAAADQLALRRIILDPSTCAFALYRVLEFLPWDQRVEGVPLICKSAHTFLLQPGTAQANFWRWMCGCLCSEFMLYVPADAAKVRAVADGTGDWQKLFSELWPLRRRFMVPAAGVIVPVVAPETSRLQAFCRVRPPAKSGAAALGEEEEAAPAAKVWLPLHQRVALLRQKDPRLSQKAAMRLLIKSEAVSEAFGGPSREGAAEQVAAASPQEGEHDGFTPSVLAVTPGAEGSVLTVSPGIGLRSWQFDHVFDESAPQHKVFVTCGLRLVNDLLNGTSGALIVYGQTGSGKTHTMFGAHHSAEEVHSGLVPRIATEILEALEVRRAAGFETVLGASYVEIFGNTVTDLLGSQVAANSAAQQRMGHRYILDGRCEVPIADRQALEDLLHRGEEMKRKARTAMNERSSRAHAIVILRLRQRAPQQERFVESSLSLVDLGGSERVSKSKANDELRCPGGFVTDNEHQGRVTWQEYYHCRQRITETNNINKGLLTLKRCIQALTDRPKHVKAGKEAPRVPFFDSKLTQLLEPALSGFSRTCFVVCCSREDVHAEETVQTLRFGKLCSSVEQEHHGDEKDTKQVVSDALKRIDEEIKEVEAEIRSKEKWEWRKKAQVHIVDEKDVDNVRCNKDEVMELGGKGAVEFLPDEGNSKKQEVEHEVWGQVLVGAEAENARREELLRRRQLLIGGGAPSSPKGSASASASSR